MTLDEFRILYESLGTARNAKREALEKHNDSFLADIEATYRLAYSGNKKLPAFERQRSVIGEVAYKAILDNNLADAKITETNHNAKIQAIIERLYTEAESIPVPVDTEFREVNRVDEYEFSTQTGSMFYARAKAEVFAAGYRQHTKSVEVIEVSNPQTSMKSGVIYAKTTIDGALLLRFKPGLGLLDDIKLCLKRGANPQVIHHNLLPVDYQERLGIDWQGNDVQKVKVA